MSGSEGPRGLDRGIAALRWLLVSAQDDESARAQVLPALSRCTVLVPTMAGAPDKLRCIAQPSGGNAMVVFTGHDALEHAAKKLGWAQGTQSVSFRAMSARDALEMASLHGTRAVIVDAAAEHALELRFDEVSDYLSRGTAEFAPGFVEPESRETGEYGLPSRVVRSAPPHKRGTGDYGPARKTNAPPGSSRATGEFAGGISELREEIAPRKARDARRDDDAGGMRARVERALASEPQAERSASPEPRRGRPREQPTQTMPPPKRRQSSGSAKAAAARKRNLAEIDDPFISSTPRQAPAGAGAGGQARRVPSLAAPPLSSNMPSAPFESSRPPSSPTEDPRTSTLAERMAKYDHDSDQTIPLDDISNAEAARDSAARAYGMSTKPPPAQPVTPRANSLPVEMFGRVDSAPVPPVTMRAVVTISTPAEPVARVAPAPVAPAHAPVAPAPVAAPPAPVHAAPVPAASAAREPEPAPRGTGTAPKPAPARTEPPPRAPQRSDTEDMVPVEAELTEAVLSAIADELRKFPEAEWACVLPDNVIGIRVDPSYLTRTKDIETAVGNVALKAGAPVQPQIVSTPADTKDARARGTMFFPWKKKR